MPKRANAYRPAHAPIRQQQRREYDRRRAAVPWRNWYKTARWAAIREAQFAQSPLCVMCLAQDIVTEAEVCDHVTPHRGDADLFWHGPFQSLCKRCHDGAKQREERGREVVFTGVDGYPV